MKTLRTVKIWILKDKRTANRLHVVCPTRQMSRRHLPTFLKKRQKAHPSFAPVKNDPHANLMEKRLPLEDNIAGHSSF